MAQATTVTWTYGTQDTDHANSSWYDAENWSPEQVPGAGDDVSIPFGEGVPSDYSGGILRSLNVLETGLYVDGDLTLTQGVSSFSPFTTDVIGQLTVGEAATLIVQGDYNNVSDPDTVVNYGTIVGHDVGYPHPSIGAPVYNHGTVTCDSGTLWLYQGGVSYPGSVLGGGTGTVQLYDSGSFVVDWTLHGACTLVGGVEIADLVSVPLGETVTCQGENAVDLYGGLFGPGTFRVETGSTLGLAGWGSYDEGLTLDNDGMIVMGDCDPYQWHGGTRIDNGGTLCLATDYRGLGVDTSDGRAMLRNTGTIVSQAIDPYIDMAVDNRGTIHVAEGSLSMSALMNYDAATRTLTGGDYLVEWGALRLEEADIAHLAAQVTLVGPSSSIEDWFSQNALRGLSSVDEAGALVLDAGQSLATGALVNSGRVSVGSGASLTTDGAYTQAAGDTALESVTADLVTTGGGTVNVAGGFLSGVGTVSSAVTCTGGWVRPGGSGTCGTLTIAGPYTQTGGGLLQIEVSGTGVGGRDVLVVTGAASLGGYLLASTLNGFGPAAGNSFSILTCGSRNGTFQIWRSARRRGTPNFAFNPVYSNTGLRLVATGG